MVARRKLTRNEKRKLTEEESQKYIREYQDAKRTLTRDTEYENKTMEKAV